MGEKQISAATGSPVERAIAAIRGGADYTLGGPTLTVNGVAVALTDSEFDRVYDVLDEVDGPDFYLRIP